MPRWKNRRQGSPRKRRLHPLPIPDEVPVGAIPILFIGVTDQVTAAHGPHGVLAVPVETAREARAFTPAEVLRRISELKTQHIYRLAIRRVTARQRFTQLRRILVRHIRPVLRAYREVDSVAIVQARVRRDFHAPIEFETPS